MPTDNLRSVVIDENKRLGIVTKVSASGIELNLPQSFVSAGRRGIARGTVGDFIFIDCDRAVILGWITEVYIPERDRSTLEKQIDCDPSVNPVGRARILATIQKTTQDVDKGVLISPRIGDGVFEASGSVLSHSIQTALFNGINVRGDQDPIAASLGGISGMSSADISLPPEEIFGRHCGIFGATGGGKSWTLAKLVAEIIRLRGKAILIDPTGEFSGKFQDAIECAVTLREENQKLVRFPIEKMTELSLFTLFRPSGQSQGPIMREAIKSLRLVKLLQSDNKTKHDNVNGETEYLHENFGSVFVDEKGCLIKSKKRIFDISKCSKFYEEKLNDDLCNFDVKSLPDQIINECVHVTSQRDENFFGERDQRTLSFCSTLILRMQGMLASSELQCLFGDEGEDIYKNLDNFLNNSKKRIFVISFKNVTFRHNTRELLLNTFGEYMLRLARKDQFRNLPVICFLDEAHQFMGRSVGDETNRVSLDAFGLIAKEGRKYGLTTVLATQRPRDIPHDVLSQLGTLIVHRLVNERDRETIEQACGDLDRAAAALIPSLSQGEAIVIGPSIPVPLPIKITPPAKSSQPTSLGPDYQNFWSEVTS